MYLIDNIISPEYQLEIQRMFILDRNIPWFLFSSNVEGGYQSLDLNNSTQCINNPQFTHLFYAEGELMTQELFFNTIKPLIESIENKFNIKNSDKNKLFRVKANLLLPSRVEGQNKWNVPHTDYNRKSNSVLYYVNDCDGDTIIFKENLHTYKGELNKDITISPKMGRAVFFNSSTFHTSSCPLNSKYRIVINFVYI